MKENLCCCGCGEIVKPGNKFINGHNRRKPKVELESQLCECGCGKLANPGRRFIKGHHNCKTPWEPKPEPQLCECGCGEYANSGYRFIIGHYWKNKKHTEESIKKMSEATTELWTNLEWCTKRAESITKVWDNDKKREKHGKAIKAGWADKSHDKAKESATKRFEDPLEREKQSVRQIKRFKENPVSDIIREKLSGKNNSRWLGGISFDPYCEKFNYTKKKEVRDKYNNCDYLTGIHRDICNIICGKIQELDVHHVDYNKQQGCDGYKWLLVPLSRRHNVMFNGNRPFWKRLIKYALEYDENYYKKLI